MADLAFHFGPGCPVVRIPGRARLGPGGRQPARAAHGPMVMVRPSWAVVPWAASWQAGQTAPKLAYYSACQRRLLALMGTVAPAGR